MKSEQRRFFIKTLLAGGIALQIPFVFSCNTAHIKLSRLVIGNDIIEIKLDLLQSILEVLFPKSTIFPGAKALKSDIYYLWVLHDSRLDKGERLYLIEDLDTINNFAKNKYHNDFTNLSLRNQQEVIELVSRTDWGENYLSRLMTVVFEGMFANPLYGSNPNKIGWEWIKYQGGVPEPQQWNKYPEILNLDHLSHEQ